MSNHPSLPLPSNRKFGFFFSGVFAVATAYFLWKSISFWIVASAILSVATVILTVVNPGLLQPFNKAWFALGMLLGRIVSPIILGILFFVIITPIALAMRVARRDELRIKMRDNVSHWKPRTPLGPDPESFRNQY